MVNGVYKSFVFIPKTKKIDRKWIQIICRERERERDVMWCLYVDEFSGQQQQR